MNAGAQSATGEILLFLHGDTRLPTGFEHWIQETLSQPGVVAGAFALKIDGSGWKLRLVEWGVSQRSRWLHLPYGDQALFLTANLFWEMGGFQPLLIMEDFELVQRLNRRGRVAIVPVPVLTSSRRWQQLGVWRTTLLNQLIILGYFLGVPCDRLAHWYRQQKKCG
jgi:rSAM/selenodomain-associated transferase 2